MSPSLEVWATGMKRSRATSSRSWVRYSDAQVRRPACTRTSAQEGTRARAHERRTNKEELNEQMDERANKSIALARSIPFFFPHAHGCLFKIRTCIWGCILFDFCTGNSSSEQNIHAPDRGTTCARSPCGSATNMCCAEQGKFARQNCMTKCYCAAPGQSDN